MVFSNKYEVINMKKVAALLIALLLMTTTAVTAFAAGINSSEQAVLDELSTSITMQGSKMTIPTEYVNQAENYFNTIDMTSAESDSIISVIKEGKTFLENSGATNISGLSFSQKQELLGYGNKVVGVLGMTMSYDQTSKKLTILAKDGSVAFAASPYLTKNGTVSDNNVIKTTGAAFNFNMLAVVGGVAVVLTAAGAVYLVKAKAKKERV